MANVKFERGLEDDVTTEIPTDGHLYVGTDTGNMYLGKNDGTKLPIGQSDWNQTDGTKSDFIKNKPEMPKERVYVAGDNVEITALTDLYTPVEYINNDARTYINTGIAPQATDFEMELVASLVAGDSYIFQHRQKGSGDLLGFYKPSSPTAPMRLYTGTSTYATTELPSNNVDVFRFVGSVKDGKATITSKNLGTGEEKSGEATIEGTPSVGTRPFCLFGNGIGVGVSYTSGVDTRIYKARIVQSGVLVMDFIPVVRKSDGRAGFYDLVTGGFFTDEINDVSVLSAGPSISKEYNIVSVPDIPTDTSDLTNGAGFITITDVPTVTVPEYTVEKLSSAEQGYASSYVLKKDGTQVGATINIPKDMVVSSGEVKTVTVANEPYQGAQVGDKYIDLTISNASQDHIYIPVKDLVDVYTAGNGIAINSNNEIRAKVSEGNGLGFGANGDIALSLVQNSANGAMASDDFRKLYDNVEMVQLLGTEYTLNNWYINSSNNYAASTKYKSYLLPVSSIGKVSIYNSATTSYYSFLKPYEEEGSSNVPGSTDYAYATGYTGRRSVAQGTTAVVSVPSDATWLWVYSGKNKALDPASLKFTGIAIGISDDIPSPSSTPPPMDSEMASVGTSTDYARADHVHPSDTSRVPTTRKVNSKALSEDITLTAADVGALPSDTVIPTVGTLNTDNTSAQSVNASESLGGTVKLHKVAKTGTYDDLLGKPTIPVISDALYKGVYFNSAVSTGQGILVKTTLKADIGSHPMFHIIGRNQAGGKLIDTYVTFYNYLRDNSKMAGPSVLHCGRDIGEIHAFVYNPDDTTSPTTGYIYIWIPTVFRNNTYHVYCRLHNSETNCVDTITKAAMFDETLVSRHSVITPYVSAMTSDVPDDADLVHRTGNETIAGTKTFTGAVVVPAPTANTHAATKKYIDDIAGDIETLLAAI